MKEPQHILAAPGPLNFDGKTLIADIEHGYEMVTFTKI
jgi:hypothetical protein